MSATRVEAEISRLIGFYLSIEQASRDMLAAARDSDWTQVGSIQKECSLLIDQVRRMNGRVVLSRNEQRAKMRIVRQIVQNEAQIRRLSHPWTDRYEQLVFGAGSGGAPAGDLTA
jgi:flagellar protein FliT